MCDDSLHHVASRSARVGDQLVSTRFTDTTTRGFAAVAEPNVAVCLELWDGASACGRWARMEDVLVEPLFVR
jgi:hypothetical protein